MENTAGALRDRGIMVETRIQTGAGGDVLFDIARSEAPRLLVLGSVGKGGVERWLLGSVSERATREAPCTSLIVRDATPFTEWLDGSSPLSVFVCSNFTRTSDAALRWVTNFTKIAPCDLVIGHLDCPIDHYESIGGPDPLMSENNSREVQRVLERDLRGRASEILGPLAFRIRVEAHWGRPDARLAAMAREGGAELLVTGSHQYQGFERLWNSSVSRGLLHQAQMNVAVVPLATGQPRGTNIPPPVRCVLVATDLSSTGNDAIPEAYALLQGGGTVHLLHVVPQMRTLTVNAGHMDTLLDPPVGMEAAELHKLTMHLRQLVPSDAAERGIFTQVEVLGSHDVAKAIGQRAERIGADVICLAKSGRSGILDALMGSVTKAVLATSRRKLLIVHGEPH
jgi:nucleotide-binding universal stress UspA family protein